MKYVKMTLEVIIPLKTIIDEETLKKKYDNDIHRVSKWLYNSEGAWWSEKTRLIKTVMIKKRGKKNG